MLDAWGGSSSQYDKELDKQLKNQTDKHSKEQDKTADNAKGRTKDVEDYVHGKEKSELNKYQYSNYAKDGGQYGRLNNRDFSTTLRLAREADRYNNKPREEMRLNNGTTVTNMGTGYERPKIQTQETRAMDQAWQLDTNQKQLAQQLQDAVNRQDLEAFKMSYQQMYQIELSDYQAQSLMIQWSRQQMTQNIIHKNREWFQRAFGYETAQYIDKLSKEDKALAHLFSMSLLNGYVPMELSERIAEEALRETFHKGLNDYLSKHPECNGDVDNIPKVEVEKIMNSSKLAQEATYQQVNNYSMKITKATGGNNADKNQKKIDRLLKQYGGV